MKKTLALLAGLLLVPAIATAQAQVSLRLDLPVVLPQLVVVSPGVQVVPDVEEEVFFTDGYYWCRHDGGWYKSRSHRSGWILVPGRAVPVRLVQLPPGRYRHYRPVPARPAPAPARYYEDRHDHDRHDRDRYDRDDDHGHGHGHEKHHGKGHDKHGD